MMPLRPLNFAQCFHDLLFHLCFRQYDPYFHLYFQLRQLGFKKFEWINNWKNQNNKIIHFKNYLTSKKRPFWNQISAFFKCFEMGVKFGLWHNWHEIWDVFEQSVYFSKLLFLVERPWSWHVYNFYIWFNYLCLLYFW